MPKKRRSNSGNRYDAECDGNEVRLPVEEVDTGENCLLPQTPL